MAHKWYPERTTYTCDLCGKKMNKPFDVPFDHKYSLFSTLKGNATPKALKLNVFDPEKYNTQNAKEIIEFNLICSFRGMEICPVCVKKTIKEAEEKSIANKENIINALKWLERFLGTMQKSEYIKLKEYLPMEFTSIADEYFEFTEKENTNERNTTHRETIQ